MSGYARLTRSSSAQAVHHQKATYMAFKIQLWRHCILHATDMHNCTIGCQSCSNSALLTVGKQLDQWIPPGLHSPEAAAAAVGIDMKWNWSCVTIGILPWQPRPTSHHRTFSFKPEVPANARALPDQSIHPPCYDCIHLSLLLTCFLPHTEVPSTAPSA